MAALDEQIEETLNRLREELALFRVSSEKLNQRLVAKVTRETKLDTDHLPKRMHFVHRVIAWFTRWRDPRI